MITLRVHGLSSLAREVADYATSVKTMDHALGNLIASIEYVRAAAQVCPHCAAGAGHHTNSATSIGGGDRRVVWDIHALDDPGGVGLSECLAYDQVWRPMTQEDDPWPAPAKS